MEPFARRRPETVAKGGGVLTCVRLRSPRVEDGPALTRLIAECPPLDNNSRYCNLLQCAHFADTCVVAETTDGLVGWISAYRPPSAPDEIFVWQVAVRADARGQGLGGRMLAQLMSRPAVRGADRLTTTVTASNEASLSMFTAFARRQGCELERTIKFERDRHFEGGHETEWQVSIGPLQISQQQQEEVA
jgi:L-2,4-diaminobutyric acid acetyltransferase